MLKNFVLKDFPGPNIECIGHGFFFLNIEDLRLEQSTESPFVHSSTINLHA